MTTVLRRSFILGRLSPNTGRARIGLRIKALLPCVSSWRISIVNSEGMRADPASNFRQFCAAEADRRHSMHDSPDRCRSFTLWGLLDGTMRHAVGCGGSGSRGGASIILDRRYRQMHAVGQKSSSVKTTIRPETILPSQVA